MTEARNRNQIRNVDDPLGAIEARYPRIRLVRAAAQRQADAIMSQPRTVSHEDVMRIVAERRKAMLRRHFAERKRLGLDGGTRPPSS